MGRGPMTAFSLREPLRSARRAETGTGSMPERRLMSAQELQPASVTFAVIDPLAWFLVIWMVPGRRLETAALLSGISFEVQATPLLGLLVCAAMATVAHTLLARSLGLHQGRHLDGSFDELLALASGVAAVAVLV